MTEPAPRPLTRRELRRAEDAVRRPAAVPAPTSTPHTAPPAVVRRRDLRAGTAPATSREGHGPRATSSGPRPGAAFVASPSSGAPAVRRRDLRSADASCTRPFALVAPAAPAAPARRRTPTAAAKGLVTVALSGALVASGLSYLQVDPTSSGLTGAAEAAAAERSAQLEARLAAARSDQASANRLTLQANAYAAQKRLEALAVAEEALLVASTAADGAAPVLGEEGLADLESAVAELSALVEKAPAPEVTVADRTTAPASRSGEDVERSPEPAETAEAPAPADDAGTAAAAPPVRPTTRTPAARVPAPEDPAADTAPETPTPSASSAALLALDTESIDLDVTSDLLAAAATVGTLSQQVEQTAQETAAAQEAARLAAEAAAAERERKIAVARDAGNGAIPADVLCDVGFDADVRLRCDAAEALERLNVAYRAEFGADLEVTSSYRSYSAQISTKASRGSLAATPGTSNHGLGLAVDLGGFGDVGQFSSPRYRWMKAHAAEFGWYHPRIMEPGGGGPQEPWHWEFGRL
ncbi:hypothetical protein GXB85_07395 [Cellulomonas sp. APG4]|uniref:M15 family metallopeptidase n=1 Tax=Cellulomonas sp. APG4 TaxID=1538656 RepID=UPI001379471B|nr:M15 family metallopeptidase [Cellulomonas sp. APG4]NCT90770.1 hypothetical protein [Cellulomonas sp. APG4]